MCASRVLQDVAYFTCPPRHGLFVKPNLVSRVVPANTTLAAAEPSPLKVSMPTAAAAPSPAEKSISERELLAAHKAHVAQVLQALRIEMQALVQFERRSAGPAPRETTDIGAYIGAVRDGHARVQQSMDSFARCAPQARLCRGVAFGCCAYHHCTCARADAGEQRALKGGIRGK